MREKKQCKTRHVNQAPATGDLPSSRVQKTVHDVVSKNCSLELFFHVMSATADRTPVVEGRHMFSAARQRRENHGAKP